MPANDMSTLFRLDIEGTPGPLRVTRMTGREAISELFELQLTLASEDDALPFRDLVGRAATLAIASVAGPRLVRGILGRVEQGDGGERTTYHARLVPRAFVLALRQDSRVFQDLTVPAIIAEVLEGAGLGRAGLDYRMALARVSTPRAYCVQYRESDWAFILRLMAEEGIHASFDHEAEGGTLVLGDRSTASPEIAGDPSLALRPGDGVEHISRFRVAEEMRPGKVTLRGYDFERPALLLESAATGRRDGGVEIYDHRSDYAVAAVGDTRARLLLEQHEASRATCDGSSCCPRLAPGFTFHLAEHGREDFNRRYLVTSVEHGAAEPGEAGDPARYQNRFACIPADVAFRPAPAGPKPAVRGVQSAVVVGPPGEEIHTDAYGRIKVQFHWDRRGAYDDKSSCWIRVAQIWAGAGFGAMHVPRVGQEVLVDFVDGDPDQPIVVGRVYHGQNLPPYPLPAHKTRSTVKSSSTPGGEGSNELRFEDRAGAEEVFLHAQKDLLLAVENDAASTVGRDESAEVTRNRSLTVGVDQSTTIEQDESAEVGRNRRRKVGNDESVEVGHDRELNVAHREATTVGADRQLDVGHDQTTTVGHNQTTTVGHDQSTTVGGDRTLVVKANDDVEVTGDAATVVVGNRVVNVHGDQSAAVDGSETRAVDGNAELAVGGSYAVTVATSMTAAAESEISLQVGECTLRIGPDRIVLTAGNSSIQVSTGGIEIRSDQEVSVDGEKIKLN